MENSSVEFQRARRRYKALLREQESLAASARSDPIVDDEIHKLEKQYENLRAPGAHLQVTHCSPPSTSSLTPSVNPDKDTGSSLNFYGSAMPSYALPMNSIPLARNPWIVEQCSTRPEPESKAGPLRPQEYEKPLTMRLGSGCVLFALQIFNAASQKSLLERWNCIIMVLVAAVAAVLESSALKSTFPRSQFSSPALPCCLIHVYNVYLLYAQRRGQSCAPQLIVYIFFDVIPSLALEVVVYYATLSILTLYGLHSPSLKC